jgi:SAM-dependent methyltransferase
MPTITEPAKLRAATTYNAASDHFDDEALGFWTRYGERTVARLVLRPGARVLDVGCGTGASALPAARQVGRTGKVIGIDLAERLLEIARQKAARNNLDNVEFHFGDMEQPGYAHNDFDAVICIFAIFFVPDMAKQVRELWRMVRPLGQLAITTWGPGVLEPCASAFWSEVKNLRPDLHVSFNPWDRITEPSAVRALFAEAGIANPDICAEAGSQLLRSPEDWWTIVLGSGFRAIVDQMGSEAAGRVREANLSWIRSQGVTSVATNVIYAVARKPQSTAV